MPRLGQDRYRARAGGRVASRLRRGIDVRGDHTQRRRHPLHLGDHRNVTRGTTPAQHRCECITVSDRNSRRHARVPRAQELVGRSVLRGARPYVVLRVPREIDIRRGALRPRGVRAPLGDDLFQEIAHARAASAAPIR